MDINTINKLKVAYYEKWDPENYGYLVLEAITNAIYFSSDLDCDGNAYFCYKSFPKVIKKWENRMQIKKLA